MNAFRSLHCVKYRPFWIYTAVFALTAMILSHGGFAEEPSQNKGGDQADEQIQIIADKMVTNNAEKFADFIGDVRASQGNLVITSERLRIYYRAEPGADKGQTGSRESIERFVASGNVQVASERYKARADQAEYDLDTKVFVLSGENSTVTSGKNILTGSKITLYRKDGQLKVESSQQKRVKAVFYPKGKAPEQNQESKAE